MRTRLFAAAFFLLVGLLIIPTAAFAASSDTASSGSSDGGHSSQASLESGHEIQSFDATGILAIAQLPAVQAIPGPSSVLIIAHGEQIRGQISASTWPDLIGAGVNVTVHTEVSRFDFATGLWSGHLAGALQIQAPDGPVLNGTLAGTIHGDFDSAAVLSCAQTPGCDTTQALLDAISDSHVNVTWTAAGGETVLHGTGTADFSAGYAGLSFAGPMDFSGIQVGSGS